MGKKHPQVGDKEYGELHARVKNEKGGISPNLSTGKDNSEKSECSTFLIGAMLDTRGTQRRGVNLCVQSLLLFQLL